MRRSSLQSPVRLRLLAFSFWFLFFLFSFSCSFSVPYLQNSVVVTCRNLVGRSRKIDSRCDRGAYYSASGARPVHRSHHSHIVGHVGVVSARLRDRLRRR